MSEHSYTSRRELDQYHFHPAVTLLAPLLAVLLGAILPRLWSPLEILDLPLIATLFFSVSRRSPIAGAFTGTVIGLLQDGLTHLPFGVFGICKAVLGYVAASIGFAVDVDNFINRVLINLLASVVQSGMLYVIQRRLLGDITVHLDPLHEGIRALANTAAAMPIFLLLDHFKQRE